MIRDILPRVDGRALIVGTSGSGKSTLAERIMREIEKDCRVIITDPKLDWPYSPRRYTLITRPEELRFEFRYPILFRPPAQEFDNPDIYEPIFREVWRRKNMTVYNDEIMFMGSTPTRHMRAILAQGRSKLIRVINGTQRPKFIPKIAITEANTIYAFYLSDEDDVRAIKREIPEYDPRLLDIERYEFFIKHRGKPAQIMRYEF